MEALTLSLSGRGQSAYYLSTANAEGKWGEQAVLDVSASYRLNDMFELGLAVKNLTNDYYEYVWWDGAQSLHSPANGRNVTASVRFTY